MWSSHSGFEYSCFAWILGEYYKCRLLPKKTVCSLSLGSKVSKTASNYLCSTWRLNHSSPGCASSFLSQSYMKKIPLFFYLANISFLSIFLLWSLSLFLFNASLDLIISFRSSCFFVFLWWKRPILNKKFVISNLILYSIYYVKVLISLGVLFFRFQTFNFTHWYQGDVFFYILQPFIF